jgi:hypothetical protein
VSQALFWCEWADILPSRCQFRKRKLQILPRICLVRLVSSVPQCHDACWNYCRSRRRRGLQTAGQQDANSSAPERVSSSGTYPNQQRGVRTSASGESGQSAASTPRDSEQSARTRTASRSSRDTAFRLEPGFIVCFLSAEDRLMGVRQSSAESRELSLVPVTSAGSVQAGSSKRMQHYPTDSMFVVGKQVTPLRFCVHFPPLFLPCNIAEIVPVLFAGCCSHICQCWCLRPAHAGN